MVQGDATSQEKIERAIMENHCTAVVNTAGYASLSPFGHSELPAILRATANAAKAVGEKTGGPLRAWFLGGLGVMDLPSTPYLLMD